MLVGQAFSQVSFSIIEPASIAGGYDFTSNGDGTNWGLPNLLNPADAVLDTVMIVDDGTPGINAQGVPFANEGCNTLINDLTGKIAFVYRYDGVSSNVCWYGTKVLMAEQAGAVGVIMVNREDALINVPGTTDGPLTSIPFAFISKTDGEIIRQKLDNGEDVIAFIGNKLGLYNDDVGIIDETTLGPVQTATPASTATSATEFGFDVGTQIYNYGINVQNNVNITATVNGPAGTWTETAGPFTIAPGDSVDVFTGGTNNMAAYSQGSYPTGMYTLTYDVDIGTTDEADYDNSLSYKFFVSDTIFSYGPIDENTMLPVNNANYRAGQAENTTCLVYDNPNGSRIAVEGMYFSAVTGYQSGVSLAGEEMAMTIYRWEDVFTDLNDPNLDFAALTTLGFGYYYYPADLQDSVVYGALDFPVQFEDNQRFLACLQNTNGSVYIGFDTRMDYTRNVNHYLQPMVPVADNTGFYALGFGTNITPATSLKVFEVVVGIDEVEIPELNLYPNPATDQLLISINSDMTGSLQVMDMSGRILKEIDLHQEHVKSIDIDDLSAGAYLVVLQGDNGVKTERKFLKK